MPLQSSTLFSQSKTLFSSDRNILYRRYLNDNKILGNKRHEFDILTNSCLQFTFDSPILKSHNFL